MSTFKALCLAPLLLAGACSVTEENNGSTTIAVDENRIEATTEELANEASEAADKAIPAIADSAEKIEERAGRVANKIDNIDVDVDVRDKSAPATNSN